MVELLLKNGARVDVEARMCWPGSHQSNCEERGRQSRMRGGVMGVGAEKHDSSGSGRNTDFYRGSDKLQCAIYYAIDGDQVCPKQTTICLPPVRSDGWYRRCPYWNYTRNASKIIPRRFTSFFGPTMSGFYGKCQINIFWGCPSSDFYSKCAY